MRMQRRYSKRELLGQLQVDYLFSTNRLPGIDASSSRWEVLAAFLKAGDARAERLIETDGGLIFLQSIPHRPNTGAIYVYNEAADAFSGCGLIATTISMVVTSIGLFGHTGYSNGQTYGNGREERTITPLRAASLQVIRPVFRACIGRPSMGRNVALRRFLPI